ncbi:hypothetical protein D3C84_1086610 [compost metagenome]
MAEVTALLFSTQAIANSTMPTPRCCVYCWICWAMRNDSTRHSVSRIRLSARPARLLASGVTSGAYLPLSTPRASGL